MAQAQSSRAPRQEQIVAYLERHPGAQLNEVFHGLRSRYEGITYESVRSALLKLIAAGRVEKRGTSTYCSPLFLVPAPTVEFQSVTAAAQNGFEVEAKTEDGFLVRKETAAGIIRGLARGSGKRNVASVLSRPIRGRRIA